MPTPLRREAFFSAAPAGIVRMEQGFRLDAQKMRLYSAKTRIFLKRGTMKERKRAARILKAVTEATLSFAPDKGLGAMAALSVQALAKSAAVAPNNASTEPAASGRNSAQGQRPPCPLSFSCAPGNAAWQGNSFHKSYLAGFSFVSRAGYSGAAACFRQFFHDGRQRFQPDSQERGHKTVRAAQCSPVSAACSVGI